MPSRPPSVFPSAHTLQIVLPGALTVLLFGCTIFFYVLPAVEDSFVQREMLKVQDMARTAASELDHLDKLVRSGEIDTTSARIEAARRILGLRYGNDAKSHFWIIDAQGRFVSHPDIQPAPDLNRIGQISPSGKNSLDLFTKTVRQNGAGFVKYDRQESDGRSGPGKRTAYLYAFRPWGWIIGTEINTEEIRGELAPLKQTGLFIAAAMIALVAGLTVYFLRRTVKAENKRARVQEARGRLLKAMAESEERYRTVADYTYSCEIWRDPEGKMLYCSPSCQRVSGYPQEDFFKTPDLLEKLIVQEDRTLWQAHMSDPAKTEGKPLDFRIKNSSGQVRWICHVCNRVFGKNGKDLGLRYSMRDVTKRKLVEEQFRHQAMHDPLTGLANRTLCLDRIHQVMQRSQRHHDYYYAVIFLDLDRFKVINDSLGHSFGDTLLVETGRRLNNCVRSLDTVARFSGDEFVILLDDLSLPGEAIRIVKRAREELHRPFVKDGHNIQLSASFGIVLSPTDFATPEDLLQNANIAMHRARDGGLNRFKVFNSRMLDRAVGRLIMESDLRRALDRNEFFLEFQPILTLENDSLSGFEALVRWNHPHKGVVPPADFIPLAEETGLIKVLGLWVIDEALETLSLWRREMPAAQHVTMSVNLSGRQFSQASLGENILALLKKHDIPPNRLKLEITESVIMDNAENGLLMLSHLRKAGVQFAIDDFGTGYSSLSELQRLPVDTLKVDRSFISRIDMEAENKEIVKAVIALAHSLGLNVVAEGVEERGQLSSLQDLNCESVQGFYFFKPLGKEDACRLIRNRKCDDSDQYPEKPTGSIPA